MDKSTINLKMDFLKGFFNIDNDYIRFLLKNDKITNDYDFSRMSIDDIIKLSKNLSISIDVLEEIFCKRDKDIESLRYKLSIYRPLGVIRKVDDLGRITLPVEQRDYFNILERDSMEISLDLNGNFLVKPLKRCVSCGRLQEIISVNNVYLCNNCINKYYKDSNNIIVEKINNL